MASAHPHRRARNRRDRFSRLPLPLSPSAVKVRAIVRYRQALRYGFEFLTLNESQPRRLRRVCEVLATILNHLVIL